MSSWVPVCPYVLQFVLVGSGSSLWVSLSADVELSFLSQLLACLTCNIFKPDIRADVTALHSLL